MADKYFYAAGGTGSWITPRGNPALYSSWYNGPGGTGGLVNYPTTGDTAIFNAASGGGTCNISQSVYCSNIITTGFTGNIVSTGSSVIVTGTYITLGEDQIFSASRFPAFITTGTCTLTSSGQTLGDLTVNGGTLTLADDLTLFANAYLNVYAGTFNANNKNVAIGALSDAGQSSAKTIIMGTGKWTIGGDGPPYNPYNVWYILNTSGSTTLNITGTPAVRLLRYASVSRLRSTSINDSTQSITIYGAVGQTFTTNTWPSSGTVLIDNEQINYSSYTVTSTMNVTLNGCTRGANSTTAATHYQYTPVFLISPQPVSKLTADLSSSETATAYVTTNSGVDGANGSLLIDSEVLNYSTKNSGTTFDGLTRGTAYGSTGAVSHLNGSIVRSVEARTFVNASGVTTPPIECWSNGNYQFTDFSGNGGSTAGGYTNVTTNNMGPQRITYSNTLGDAAAGTYYAYMNGGDEDFFSFF